MHDYHSLWLITDEFIFFSLIDQYQGPYHDNTGKKANDFTARLIFLRVLS